MAWLDTLSKEGLKDFIAEQERKLTEKRHARDDVGKSWTPSKIESWKRQHDIEIKELEDEIADMQAELDTSQ